MFLYFFVERGTEIFCEREGGESIDEVGDEQEQEQEEGGPK